MLGGMGYATTSAAMADDAEPTLEQQAGISMGLHDYNRNTINDGHALWFKNSGSQYNRYVGSGKGAYTGIVNTTLRNGYPTMAADKGSESLDYLFGGKPVIAVTSYKPTGGLLTLDNDGYYGFDAASHYASYDKASNRFTLTDKQCGGNAPCFTPFGNDTSDNRYSFGMNLGADFYMPKDGKVNNRDMVFDFTGDDDVWVFIDGVLVLDLGGIHDALHGSIDFATGAITYDTTPYHGQPAGTISQAFDNAGKTWDSTPYKIHHLSFFYLERGDGGSNCKIRFNLPVKPSKAIDIEKQTLGTIEADKQFQFQLFVDGSSTPYQGKYSVYDAYTNQVESDKQTGDNGVITLTKGQFARVQSDTFTDDTKYTVRELNSSGYTVSANGSPMTQQGGGDNAYAETDSFTVGKTSHVTIVNSNVKPSNNKSIVKTNGGKGDEYTLNLTASGDSTSSTVTTVTPADIVSAKIKVFSITDTLSQWVDPVKFAGAANGADITQYVTVKNGSTTTPTSEYTATYSVDDSGKRTVTVTFNGTDGIVVEKTDVIDVSFKVKPSDAAYADYANGNNYPDTGDANTGDVSAGQRGYYSNADAKLNYCVLTEVNNVTSCEPTEAEYPHPVVQVKLGKIKITKQWKGSGEHADSVTVQLQRKAIDASTDAENVDTITLNADNQWTATVGNLLPGYTYSVVETSGDDRYDVSYEGNNTKLTKEMVWSSKADAGTLNATITNTRKTVSLSNAISVKKNLTDREWKDSDQFSFTLEAKNNAPLPASCKDQQPCTVTVNHDSTDHTKSFGDITYNAGADTYTYYVTENSGNIAALHYSQAEYQVVVAVCKKGTTNDWEAVVESVTKTKTDSGVEGAWSEDKTQPMTFTNQYISASSLPLTGRMGAERWWQLAASGIGVLALLAVVATDQWRRKKRLS
ncbi:Spy0128 family protein [uncultured Bifidobacterium sp.]|uniref:DUF7604 domain-containing protein n=1 Tax=uncultured Bifidobacterium sp. TaxID=165187 RepID=UPI00258EFB82|nr:FctA domain-containing protein [uncultured Bifidobacterium sp.]